MFHQSCQCPNMTNCSCGCGGSINGCPRPQPLIAPRRVCVSQQVTPVPQPVICPIECRRVNRCMYFPVFYPQYEQTFMTVPSQFPNAPFAEENMGTSFNQQSY